MDYMIEMEFASLTRPAFKDVYFTIKELPYLQNLRIGHFKEPFGLEEMTSDNSTTFMERSLSDDGAIIPGRNVGVMGFGYTEDLMTSWAGGAFVSQIGEDPPIYQNDEASYAWTMRATRLLWYDDASDGRGLFHTGLDYSFRTYADDLPRVWRSRPERICRTWSTSPCRLTTSSFSPPRRPSCTGRSPSRRSGSATLSTGRGPSRITPSTAATCISATS